MSTYEERIAILEQTSVSRIDFLNAVNRVMLQQAQSTSETYHEITMLLGVVGSQGVEPIDEQKVYVDMNRNGVLWTS